MAKIQSTIEKDNIKPRFWNDIAFFYSILHFVLCILHLRCQIAHLPQHILNEYTIPRGGIVDEDVGDSSHELAVLYDGRATHECGQEGTTKFNRDLTVESINRLKLKQQVPFLKSFP